MQSFMDFLVDLHPRRSFLGQQKNTWPIISFYYEVGVAAANFSRNGGSMIAASVAVSRCFIGQPLVGGSTGNFSMQCYLNPARLVSAAARCDFDV